MIGIGVGLVCYFFDVSFAFFWGLFATLAVYIQMIGPLVQNPPSGSFCHD